MSISMPTQQPNRLRNTKLTEPPQAHLAEKTHQTGSKLNHQPLALLIPRDEVEMKNFKAQNPVKKPAPAHTNADNPFSQAQPEPSPVETDHQAAKQRRERDLEHAQQVTKHNRNLKYLGTYGLIVLAAVSVTCAALKTYVWDSKQDKQ